MHHPTDRITHTMAFVMPDVEHWLEREIAEVRCPTDAQSVRDRYLSVSNYYFVFS